MIIESITAGIAILNGINSGIATLRESRGNAEAILGRFADASAQIRALEAKQKRKRVSPKEAFNMSLLIKRQKSMEAALKDACLMAQMPEVWRNYQQILEDDRLAHEKEMKALNAKLKKRREMWQEIGQIMGIVCAVTAVAIFAMAIYFNM
tara:strand:- start:195 stop:647 length:453 start_codon:yes stop_codon:yes gene_type:complete